MMIVMRSCLGQPEHDCGCSKGQQGKSHCVRGGVYKITKNGMGGDVVGYAYRRCE